MAAWDTRRMSDEEILALVRELADEDPELTQMDFYRETGISPSTIQRRFRSWPETRERVGLPPKGRSNGRRKYTREDVQTAFRKAVAEVGPAIRLLEFCERAGFRVRVVMCRCGSWNELRASEGLPRNKRGQKAAPKEKILESCRRIVTEVGKGLTLREFCRRSGYTETMVHRRFGSWRALREAEGVPENKPQLPDIPDEAIRAEYARIKKLLRRPPKFSELGTLSKYGEDTFRRRFRLFEWRAALQRAMAKRIAERKAELAAKAAR